MIRPEAEALLQGALDDTLTPDERARLARLLSDSPDAKARAAELTQLTGLIDSLGAADAPPDLVKNVLAQVSHRPHIVRPSTFQRGVTVNKKILFGLAAAAAIVLAVITFTSNPPATEGTEATIGAAQRAQTPQIAANDVKLGDTSAQDVLQTETFDAIMKDETLRTMLQDASLRAQLSKTEMRSALTDARIRVALESPELMRQVRDPNFGRSLDDAALAATAKKVTDANIRALLSNKAMVNALRNPAIRELLARKGVAAALAGDRLQRAIQDRGFEAAMRSDRFAAQLAGRPSAR